jgi:hypothetical protein
MSTGPGLAGKIRARARCAALDLLTAALLAAAAAAAAPAGLAVRLSCAAGTLVLAAGATFDFREIAGMRKDQAQAARGH